MKAIIALALFVGSTEALIQCLPNACMTVRCAAATPCNGRFVQGGGYCGCCDACVAQIAEGGSCINMLLLGAPTTAECEPGTHCDVNTMRCVKDEPAVASVTVADTTSTACNSELSTYTLNQQSEKPLLGARKPTCDENGLYTAKQCEGSQCYCVMKDGKKIDGYSANIWESQHQTCQCARDQAEYMASGLIGKFFYCSSDGSYQQYKCVGSVCFCADSNGNQLGAESVNIGEVQTLSCFQQTGV